MRNISSWASRHLWMARLFLLLCIACLYLTGYVLGNMLLVSDVLFPSYLPYVFLLLFILCSFFYPDKAKKERFNRSYKKQKTVDLLLSTLTFLMIVGYSQQAAEERTINTSSAYASIASAPSVSVKEPKPKAKKGFRKKLAAQWKAFRQYYKSRSTAGKTALIILTIVVAFILLYLVAALSCTLACSDAAALAVLVALLGTGAVIFGIIKAIQRINRMDRNKEKKKTAFAAVAT